ncbi:MAG: aminoacyl-tRNA hydrolase [Desulfobacterota bacterium]|nr:aminoacyl-tRNA hydrolase [Thermodesulfobacteriota bacterium]
MPSANSKPRLIFGLGNPGAHYAATRHNIGFLTITHIAQRHAILLTNRGCGCVYGTGAIHNMPVVIAQPMVFMNRSGRAVSTLMACFNATADDILVVHDDMDIPFGFLKIKTRGGSAGHLGIQSIIDHLATNAFTRIRIGIGKPPRGIAPRDYVLGKFSEDEQDKLPDVLEKGAMCCEAILMHNTAYAMNMFHRSSKTPTDPS